MFKFWMVVLVAIALQGCVAPQIAGLSYAEVQALKIETVEVSADPEGNIWWGKAEREYAEKVKDLPPVAGNGKPKKAEEPVDAAAAHAAVVESPEGKAFLRQKISGMMKERLVKVVVPQYQGTRRVKLLVVIKGMVIPSAAQRVVFGGVPMISGYASVVDVATGAVLGKTPENSPLLAAAPAGNGWLGVLVDQAFADLEDRLMDSFADRVVKWLPKSAPEKVEAKASL
jgi:hypothetical protein